MRPGSGAHSFMKTIVAIKYLLRRISFATLCLGVVFLYPDSLFSAFETFTLSPIQNAAGVVPFGIYDNSIGALSDPTFLVESQPLFCGGIILKTSSMSAIHFWLSTGVNGTLM